MSTDPNDLGLLLDSRVPILVIESSEEPRVFDMITGLAVQRTLPYFTWSITEELNRLGFGAEPEPIDSPDATNVLKAIKAAGHPGLYVLCDFHPYLKDKDDLIDIRWPCSNRDIHETNSWSVVMEEKIRQLRQWATDRRVFANE